MSMRSLTWGNTAEADREAEVRALIVERLEASYNLARLLLGDRATAEDATHDAVIRALRSARGSAPEYRLMTGSGLREGGTLYLYDAANAIVVGFSKDDGRVRGAWSAEGGEFTDIRDMEVVTDTVKRKGRKRKSVDRLVWVTPDAV
jgi:hypothetical protein